jgi:hypothetical protein
MRPSFAAGCLDGAFYSCPLAERPNRFPTRNGKLNALSADRKP